jgi:hypothetical protein
MRVFRSPESMNASDPPLAQGRYFVSHNGEVKGPFDLDMIEAFVLSGHYPRGIQICAVGSKEWKSFVAPLPKSAGPSPGQSSQRAAGKPTRVIPKWIFVVGGIFGALIVLSLIVDQTGRGASTDSSPARTATDGYSVPRTFQPESVANPPDVLSSDSNGHTYRVRHSDYEWLSKKRKALDQEDAIVKAAQAELNAEGSSLEQERIYLDRTNQFEINDFNAKIDAINAKRFRLGRQIDAFNSHVDAFNADLARVGTPVN